MTNYKKRLGTAIATVAILANAYTPAFAGTTITITGNGADSDNDAVVNNSQNTTVNQTNSANFTNNVSGSANTGDNDANKNNGGTVTVKTGDASVNNTVSNAANQNWANVSCCGQGNTEVKIGNNAADSNNTVNLYDKNTVKVNQDNDADFHNYVNGTAKTGNNDANKNNGGDVTVKTGDAWVNNTVTNWANANSAKVGSKGDGSDVSLKIVNNGAGSDNDIVVNKNSTVNVTQDNDADFYNKVKGKANTGDNNANQNNGGDVTVETGDASVNATVDNMANFNWADLNCGCLFGDGGLTVNIDKNAADSDNNVNGYFKSKQKANQDNDADFNNHVKNLNATTGNNDANENNPGGHGDPSIHTGDASVGADVNNTANLNGLGGNQPEWPSWNWNGIHVSLDFNLSDLLAALGL